MLEQTRRYFCESVQKENKKLKCKTLIESNIQGELKFRDKKGKEYPDIESFRNRMSLPKIEIKESLKKKKGNVISPKKKEEQLR